MNLPSLTVLRWIIENLLTDSQLDAKMPNGETVRDWYGRNLARKGK